MQPSDIESSLSSATPAALWRRLAALLYDLFPLLALWMIAAFVFLYAGGGHYDPRRPGLAARLGLQLVLLAVTAAYFWISWTRIGATIGMRAWKLKLVRDDGTKPRALQALLRFFLALPSLSLAGVGFWWALFDPQRRTLHDRLCGTRMIRLP
ncbi:MAG TPA: RDD family protein [Rhodanobacteraceae bacterium]|nr:RDD family protein [Rhodanobacteraceae bacterium]